MKLQAENTEIAIMVVLIEVGMIRLTNIKPLDPSVTNI